MNTQLEEFINQKKIEKIEEQKKEREELLISLGLVDTSKIIKKIKYFEYNAPGCRLDASGRFFKEVEDYGAIDITDEEYEELLKYIPVTQIVKPKKTINTTWANAIHRIGILYFVTCLLTGFIFWGILDNTGMFILLIFLAFLILPFFIGFSKIVAMAETYLQKQEN